MDRIQPETAAVSGQIIAPQNAPKPEDPAAERVPFTALPRERIGAFAMYALAYLYIDKLLLIPRGDPHTPWWVAAFVVAFVALTEYLHRETPRSRESWVWLGCLLTVAAAIALGRCHAWYEQDAAWDVTSRVPLFLHVFAVWWVLSRSGALLEGESGRLLPLDALDGFVAFPFRHFFLRLRTVGFALSRLRGAERREKPKVEAVLWSAVISAAALGLLAWATGLLMRADSGFAALLSRFVNLFRFEWSVDLSGLLSRFLLSLPVGAYLFGLLDGTLREDKSALRRRAENVAEQMQALRGVPERVWLVLLALFCALYALFFAVQGQYLFGAFTGAPAEGFSVAEYARQGFFELCKVMAVNFALLWLVTRSSKVDVRQQKAARALCLALLAESFLLSVVAFSKLYLYIDLFGFTPRRLQSTWLVCVLAFGCGCAAWSLMRSEKTFRVWMMFGAVTLSLLCLY